MTQAPDTEQISSEVKRFTKEEVAKHKTAESCWIILEGKVYDVTKFLDDHPGGGDAILEEAGTDATTAFKDAGHSTDAKKLRKDYCIGDLETGAPKQQAQLAGEKPPLDAAPARKEKSKGCCTVL